MAKVQKAILASRIASQFNDPKYSDLTIICGDRKCYVHRIVLCAESVFFKVACNGKFLEAASNEIKLPEDEPMAVERMLKFLYTGDYDDTDNEDSQTAQVLLSRDPSPGDTNACGHGLSDGSKAPHKAAKAPVQVNVAALMNTIDVYTLADKYDMLYLQVFAKSRFKARANDEWATVDIVTIMPIVYSTTPDSNRGLRKIMLDVCLRSTERLKWHESFRTMLKGDASMSFDFLDAVLKDSEERAYKAIEPKLIRVVEWTKLQERVMKTITEMTVTCSTCSTRLDLTMSNGETTEWYGPLIVKCRNCGKMFGKHQL
ncbi:MAG: hypothetical protein Q9169_006931 [Polycauliona sp. 2 TL-2023]